MPAAPAWRDEEDGVLAAVPLLVEGDPIGLLVARYSPERIPDEATRRLVETIAGHAAQPLERAHLHEREHEARVQAELSGRRTRRLQALTAAFAGALTPAEVAATLLDETFEAVGAGAAALAVIDDEGRELNVVHSRDFPEELLGPEGAVPLTAAGPAATAVRLQEVSYYESTDALLAEHPELRGSLAEADPRSYAFLPVSAGAAPLGVAVFAWSQPGRLSTTSARSSRRSSRSAASRSTAHAATRASASSPRRSSGASSRRPFPRWRACASPRSTCPGRTRSTSVATGSTR